MATSEIDPIALRVIINHVFLPPKLPDGADEVLDWEETLLQLVESSLACFEKLADAPHLSKIHRAQKSLLKLITSRQRSGYIDEEVLRDGFSLLSEFIPYRTRH